MDDNGSDAIRNNELAQSDYPTPPELNIAAWKNVIKSPAASAQTKPHLLTNLDGPSQQSSNRLDTQSSTVPVQSQQDLYRRATWAPDGTVILAITESQHKHILSCGFSGEVERVATLKSPSPLLDAVWYPLPAIEQPSEASSHEDGSRASTSAAGATATWCFAESHRDLPIRLTSSKDGRACANYSIMNHVEKFVGPHSLAFSPDLSRVYCGLYFSLAVFPLSRPGLNTHAHIPLIAGKHSIGGQRGIVSALATTTHPSEATTRELIAVGTFTGTIGVYDLNPTEFPEPAEHTEVHTPSHNEGQTLAQASCIAGWSEIEGDGITQLKFHPLTPHVLFVASRRSDYIYVYDIRYLMGDTSRWMFRPLTQAAAGVRAAHLLAKLPRPGGGTHQRFYFDVDWAGRWLASGDEQGKIHLWRIDAGRFTDQPESSDEEVVAEGEALELLPDLSWQAHEDSVGSVSFHPYQPWLVSVSGSRHWPEAEAKSDSDASSDDDEDGEAGRRPAWTTKDNSLKVWDFSEPPTSTP